MRIIIKNSIENKTIQMVVSLLEKSLLEIENHTHSSARHKGRQFTNTTISNNT